VPHFYCLRPTHWEPYRNWRRGTSEEPTVETVRDGYAPFYRVPELARRGVTLTIIDTAGGWPRMPLHQPPNERPHILAIVCIAVCR
jgi:hypothetical protein